jgi:hypothetical protein
MLVKGRARRTTPLRVATFVASGVATALTVAFALEAVLSVANAVQRASFPYAVLQYSEPQLFVQLQRMASGGPPYLSTLLLNSSVFGPVYLYLLAGCNAILHGPVDVPSDRSITMIVGLCGLVPLVFSAVFIARRATSGTSTRVATQIAAAIAATLGLAVLSRAMTFDALHPDDLLFTLVATMFACYNAATSTARNARFAMLLAVAGALACFTEAHAAALGPVLLLALAATRAISLRALVAGLAAYAATFAVAFGLAGADGRAWAFLVPLAQPTDFSPWRLGLAVSLFAHWHPYLGVLLASTALTLAFLWRRTGLGMLATDVLPVVMVLETTVAGFFYRGGLRNSLFLAGVLCVPYFAAMIAALATPRVLALRNLAGLALAACGVVLGVSSVWALHVPPRQVPTDSVSLALANAQDAAVDLCSRRRSIVVLALPDLFAACPTASYALGADYIELSNAFPGYYAGPTIYDKRLDADYAVTTNSLPLPPAWTTYYTLEKSVPVWLGFEETLYPGAMMIFKHV